MDKFRRVEEKYLINKFTYNKLLNKIKKYIKEDVYPKYTICSIYFDNDSNESIINSLEKPIYKEKIRVRSYGVIRDNDYLFLELKKKYKGIVDKKRIKLTLNEFNKYLDNKFSVDSQIFKEIDYIIKKNNYKPKIFIAYDRLSYVGINDDIRITFDSRLRSRSNDLVLNKSDEGKLFFTNDTYIMEIKAINSIPIWLSIILSELEIYPISFSKYGEIYKKGGIYV